MAQPGPKCCTAAARVLAKSRFSRANAIAGKPRRKVLSIPRAYGAARGAFSLAENAKNRRGVAGENGIVSGMAGRYATALFELARESNALDQVQSDLNAFNALVASSPDLTRLVRSPLFSAQEQAKALDAVLDKAGISGVARNFLRVVTANRRLFAVDQIIRGFNALVAKHKGEVTAQVTVAEPLNDARMNEIRDALRQVTGKDVKVDVHVDPSIIGGLKVKVGSRMVDASLRTKLNSIKFAMKEAR
jgi:F-type H+-transporting ATPase subunit delta